MGFYKNLATFLIIPSAHLMLDGLLGRQTELTNSLIMGFFLVWNLNQTEHQPSEAE